MLAWWAIILCACWLSICGVWGSLLVAQLLLPKREIFLQPDRSAATPTARPWPSVCVVIPARNEARDLADCVGRVLAQDYPALSLMIGDDRSTDSTLQIARDLAAGDPRISVCAIDALPEGWMGKSHALWRATREVSSDWLLFIDADCRLDPSAITTVVLEAERRGAELLTLWPRHAGQSFWEHMLIPLCGAVIMLWFGSQSTKRRPRRPAFANGQFLLMRRDAYERIDGHRSVRDALIEDVVLAEHARLAQVSSYVASGRDLVSVRMYTSLAGILNGWARIYVGALRSGVRIVLSVAWLLFGSLLPYVAAIVIGCTAALSAGPAGPHLRACALICLLHLLLLNAVSYRFWSWGRCPHVYLWLYPLSTIAVIAILARAGWWLSVRHRVTWRHTSYRIDSRGRIQRTRPSAPPVEA